jgi:transposase
MAYSSDIKRLAMAMVYGDKSTYEHVCKTLKIGFTTLKTWIKLNKNNNLYTKKPRSNASRKINDDDLRAYIAKNTDAYLYEIAEHLGVSKSGIHKACRRLKISYKKNSVLQREKRNRTA